MKTKLSALLILAALTACNPNGEQAKQPATASGASTSAEKPQADQTPLKPHTDIQGEVVKVQTARASFPCLKIPNAWPYTTSARWTRSPHWA